ncbi:MAG: TaqI-like C-terminal specificity domain-containing protein, partial [Phototrophicales bacterium]|nr:TaqI-like C-terminal specificity domain-containing protein [Phototrophicales bacterium]
EFERPKIIYPDIALNGKFTLDLNGYYIINTMYMISGLSQEQNHYLLGILNSDIFTKLFTQISSTIRGGYLRWIAQYMEKMPIPTATDDQRATLIGWVEKQLAYHAELATLEKTASDRRFELSEKIGKADSAIDELVAGLYGVDAGDVALLG